MGNVKELTAQVDAVHMKDGIAAQMVCTVLPQLLTVHLLPKRHLFLRWLPTSSVKELTAQVDAVHMLIGTAAQMDFIVLPLLLTVHMLPRSNSLSRWLQRQSAVTFGLCALEDAANGDMEHGCAAQMECTVLQH